MPAVQDTFSTYPQRLFEGQIATQQRYDIMSGIASDTIWFGRAVVRSAGHKGVSPFKTTSTAADVVGVSARQGNAMSMDGPFVGTAGGQIKPGYFSGKEVDVFRSGAIAVLCVDGAKSGDKVHVINTEGENLGRFTHGTGIELNLAFWRDDTPAGTIGIIEVNKNFTV